jgi:formamidopyrimidine-DNA glycosylase
MIAGRFRWKSSGASIPGKVGLLALDFENGTLILTEAGSKRQASLHVVQGEGKACSTRSWWTRGNGGPDLADFAETLRRGNHTLKRALTDPHLFSGIGNAYSDEIFISRACRRSNRPVPCLTKKFAACMKRRV